MKYSWTVNGDTGTLKTLLEPLRLIDHLYTPNTSLQPLIHALSLDQFSTVPVQLTNTCMVFITQATVFASYRLQLSLRSSSSYFV